MFKSNDEEKEKLLYSYNGRIDMNDKTSLNISFSILETASPSCSCSTVDDSKLLRNNNAKI